MSKRGTPPSAPRVIVVGDARDVFIALGQQYGLLPTIVTDQSAGAYAHAIIDAAFVGSPPTNMATTGVPIVHVSVIPSSGDAVTDVWRRHLADVQKGPWFAGHALIGSNDVYAARRVADLAHDAAVGFFYNQHASSVMPALSAVLTRSPRVRAAASFAGLARAHLDMHLPMPVLVLETDVRPPELSERFTVVNNDYFQNLSRDRASLALRTGWIGENVRSEFADDIAATANRATAFTNHELIPWKAIAYGEKIVRSSTDDADTDFDRFHMAIDSAHTVAVLHCAMAGAAAPFSSLAWRPHEQCMRVVAHALAFADASMRQSANVVPETPFASIISQLNSVRDVQSLGRGSYGIVVAVARGRDPTLALKVKRVDTDLPLALHEVLVHELLTKSTRAVTPYVPALEGYFYVDKAPSEKVTFRTSYPGKWETVFRTRIGLPISEVPTKDKDVLVRDLVEMLAGDSLAGGLGSNLSMPRAIVVTAMPHYDLGSLKHRKPEDPREVATWMFQTTHSLVGMHAAAGLVHMDIKPANIFVRSVGKRELAPVLALRASPKHGTAIVRDASPKTVVAIGDFGLSVLRKAPYFAQLPNLSGTYPVLDAYYNGTHAYVDPTFGAYFDTAKSLFDNNADFAQRGLARGMGCDVWALGVTFIELWLRLDPDWPEKDGFHLIEYDARLFDLGTEIFAHLFGTKDQAEFPVLQRELHPLRGGSDWKLAPLERMLHGLLLYKAFWPDKDAETWTLPAKGSADPDSSLWLRLTEKDFDKRIRELEPEITVGGEKKRRYQHAAAFIKKKSPRAFRFIKKCLAWHPATRAEFLLSGDALFDILFHGTDRGAFASYIEPYYMRGDAQMHFLDHGLISRPQSTP